MLCQAVDCFRESCTKAGLCVMHYKRLKRNGTTNRVLTKYEEGAACSFCKTGNVPLRKGLCKACAIRKMRKGYVERDVAPKGAGTTTKSGYRLITVDGKRVYEHRHMLGAKPGEVIHHEEEKDNNNADYLIRFPNQSEHMKYHAQKKRDDHDTIKRED